jgi:RNA polymerase sigma factor (TIGR02999 family)
MTDDPQSSLTDLLKHFSKTRDKEVAEAILREVLPKLHRIAARALGKESRVAPFSATELINEVWARTLYKGGWEIRERGDFFAIAAHAVWEILVEDARRRLTLKRGQGRPPDPLGNIEERLTSRSASPEEIVAFDEMMDRLGEHNPELLRIFEMRHVAGFTLEETAAITGLSLKQVRSRWEAAVEWLGKRLRTRPK